MDEWPEFSRDSLEACRVPMETGQIALERASGSTILDASPLVIVALNPCPCGKHTSKSEKCFCSPSEARAYVGKLSGPIADRFAIHLEMSEEVVNMAKVDDFSRFLKKSDDKRGIIDENGVKTSKNESFDLERVRVGVEMMVNAVKNDEFFAFFESFLSVSENFSDVLSDLEKFLNVLRKKSQRGRN